MKPVDLLKLSKEEKLAMIDLIDEQARRAREKKDVFEPHGGQLPICQSEKFIRAVVSSNSFGKTALCTNEALWAVNGYNPIKKKHTHVPANIVVVLDAPEKVDKVWMKELRKWANITEDMLHKHGKPHVNEIRFPNGSAINFMFHDQEPMKFESLSDISGIIMDEMPPRSIFIALTRGQRDKGLDPWILIASTMIGTTWVYKDLYIPWSKGEREDVDFFSGNIWQNEKNLAEGYIDRFARNLTDKEKAVRLNGAFDEIDGLALAHLFRQDIHVISPIKWPHNWPVVVAIDPAMRKPHVAIMLGVTPENSYVYLKEMQVKGDGKAFAKELKEFYRGFKVADIVCDSMGSGDLTGGSGTLSFIRVLQDAGIRVRATTFDEKDDEAFINMIQQVLVIPEEPDNFGNRLPRLRIVQGNKGIISDLETAAWMTIRNSDELKPKIDITKKDRLACVKYALAAQPRFNHGREKPIRAPGPVGIRNNEKRKFSSSR
jgi:hypothetical protein